MYGILLLSHGNLAKEFLNTSEMIMGEQSEIIALGLDAQESRENFEKRVKAACMELYKEDGVLILTDLFGGTPTNSAIFAAFMEYEKLEILTGLNLSMLLEALMNRKTELEELVTKLKKAGAEGIKSIREAI